MNTGGTRPTRKDRGPSVTDPALPEKLCGDGNSQKKSARTGEAAAATSHKTVSKNGGKSAADEDWPNLDLDSKSEQIGVKGRSTMA